MDTKSTMWMGLAALAVLCLLPGMAIGQPESIIVERDEPLDDIFNSLTGDAEITFTADLAADDERVYWSFLNTIPIKDNITLRGTAPLPWNFVLSVTESTGGIFDIQDGGSLTIEHLSLEGGGAGVTLSASDAKLTLDRCYVANALAAGVEMGVNGGEVTIGNSVFTSCPAALHMQGAGSANIHQSTLIETTGPPIIADGGVLNAAACIFYDNAFPPDVTGAGAEAKAYGCYFHNPEEPGGFDEIGQITLPTGTLEFVTDSNWKGNLREDEPAYADNYVRVDEGAFTPEEQSLFNDFLNGTSDFDFENELRGDPPQAGADHVGGGLGQMRRWLACIVTPDPVGLGGFEVQVIFSHVTNVTDIVVKPQSVSLTNPADLAAEQLLVPTDAVDNTGTFARAVFDVPGTFLDVDGAGLLPVDGNARVYVRAEGAWWGVDTSNIDRMEQPAIDGSEFIIDTTPPKLASVSLTRGNGRITVSNDAATPAAGVGLDFPADWAPGNVSIPSNDTTFGGGGGNAQVFLNGDPAAPLNITVEMVFLDEPPRNPEDNSLYSGITPGGFVRETLPQLTSATAADTLSVLTEGYDRFGTAFWVPDANVTTVINNSAPGVSTSQLASGQELTATWTLTGLGYLDGWRMTTAFGVTDLAGNEFTTPTSLDIWWMINALAEFTSGPSTAVVDPIFRWQLSRALAPSTAYPCYPIAQFRLWAPDGSGWSAVTEWSEWQADPTITNDTIVRDGARLSLYLSNANFKGVELMLTVRGADEAGNVQPVDTVSDAFLDPADIGLNPGQVWTWENAGEQRRLDTEAQVELWHNRVVSPPNDPSMWEIDPDERTFGSSPRVPLPEYEEACEKRVEGRFTFTANLPDDLASPSDAIIVWSLYEEGRRVAFGTIPRLDPEFKGQIQIPQDLLFPGATPYNVSVSQMYPFLNNPPEKCGVATVDRLGDEGAPEDDSGRPLRRQRDVEYLLVGYAQESSAATGFAYPPAKDATPVSIRFTVTAGEGAGGEEQPIKVFSRGE